MKVQSKPGKVQTVPRTGVLTLSRVRSNGKLKSYAYARNTKKSCKMFALSLKSSKKKLES